MTHKPPRTVVIVTLTLAGLIGAASAGLRFGHPGPEKTTQTRPAALTVEARAITLQDGFAMQRTFSGRVQAKRESVIGFESAGRLARVLADEGASVERGQLLAELDTARLEAQRRELIAGRAEAEARLALAGITLKRMRGVVDKGGVSRQGLDEAREAERAAEAALALADERIATIDVELGKTRVVAPFAATVIARSADEGRVLEAGQPVLTLQERAAPEIRIGVAGRTLDQLEPGRVYSTVWRGRTVTARLRALLPVRAATTRTVDALFDPLDPPVGMLPGDIVTLALENRIAERGSWLPLSALAEGERGLWSLYVVEPLAGASNDLAATHRVARRTVDVVYQRADRVFVKGALDTGQRVAVTGLQRIVPGQLVRLASDTIDIAEVGHD